MEHLDNLGANQARFELGDECQQFLPRQLLPKNRLTLLINTLQVKNLFCQIDTPCYVLPSCRPILLKYPTVHQDRSKNILF